MDEGGIKSDCLLGDVEEKIVVEKRTMTRIKDEKDSGDEEVQQHMARLNELAVNRSYRNAMYRDQII